MWIASIWNYYEQRISKNNANSRLLIKIISNWNSSYWKDQLVNLIKMIKKQTCLPASD